MIEEESDSENVPVYNKRHVSFLRRILNSPNPVLFSSLDSNRMMIAYFCVSGLDLLDEIKEAESVREWIMKSLSSDGFNGSPGEGWGSGHIAMTYSALSSLLILGDDLSKIDKEAIIQGVRSLQLENGAFKASFEESESDLRFLYCASAICYLLNDWSGMNVNKAAEFVLSTLRPEGGFAQNPDCEAHGGSTFCAVAALYLMDRLDTSLTRRQRRKLERWCLYRVNYGVQGRPNKSSDTCYSFWLGAALKLLGVIPFLKADKCLDFTLSMQDAIVGGFSKWLDQSPDPLHTYFGLAGLSVIGNGRFKSLKSLHPALNISTSAFEHLQNLHKQWVS